MHSTTTTELISCENKTLYAIERPASIAAKQERNKKAEKYGAEEMTLYKVCGLVSIKQCYLNHE
jgi:hypothetical protein